MMVIDKIKNDPNVSEDIAEKLKVIQGMENILDVQDKVKNAAKEEFIENLKKQFKGLPEGTEINIDVNDYVSHKVLDISFKNDDCFITNKSAGIRFEFGEENNLISKSQTIIDRDIIKDNPSLTDDEIKRQFKQALEFAEGLQNQNKLVPAMAVVFDRDMRATETWREKEQMCRNVIQQYNEENSLGNKIKEGIKEGVDNALELVGLKKEAPKPDMMQQLNAEIDAKAEQMAAEMKQKSNVSSLDYQRVQSQKNATKKKNKFGG